MKSIKPAKGIEIIARGVCVCDGFILLCQTAGASNTYLPGGHVEPGESSPAALEREIAEELGCRSNAGRFLGVVEHGFVQKGRWHYEVNLVFELNVPGLVPARDIVSAEAHLAFLWQPLGKLTEAQFEPAVLISRLKAWLNPGFKGQRRAVSIQMVPGAGLEPAQCCHR